MVPSSYLSGLLAISGCRLANSTFYCRVEEIRDTDIGTRAGLFEVLKIGDEFYSFLVDCKDPKACTILLRGASKDVLNEVRPPCLGSPLHWPVQRV